ncbi:unnamed protein product [Boreogadus saida]
MVEDAGNSTELRAILGGNAHLKPTPNQTITQPEPTPPETTQPETTQPETRLRETRPRETRPRETRPRETRSRNEPRRQQRQPCCAPDRRTSERPPEASAKGGGVWQPGPGQLRIFRAPEEQVEKQGLNSPLLHSFGSLPALELLHGETGPRGSDCLSPGMSPRLPFKMSALSFPSSGQVFPIWLMRVRNEVLSASS